MAPKRILLLGASKNIGYHVLELLAPEPEKYTLFVFARSAAVNIAPFGGKENVTFIQGDAKDETALGNAITSDMNGQVDFVIFTVGRVPHLFRSEADFVLGSAFSFNKFMMPKMADPTLW
jgi:short-subunit dehydrogenase